MNNKDRINGTDSIRAWTIKRYRELMTQQYNSPEATEARKKAWEEIADLLWETPGEKRP